MTSSVEEAAVESSPRPGLGYLPALDGLRALSLLAILLYHSGLRGARGGYLGVTIFFTLSGFLITSLLLREREVSGTIRLRSFWRRRAQRLVPGVLVMFALIVAYLALAGGQRPAGVVGDAISTATWVANWRFIASGASYAGLFGDPSPFQHMWSLAVEEQLYLLLPGFVLLCLGRRGAPRRWRLASALGLFVVASTVACSALAHTSGTSRAYFGTDARIAEPLVGSLLALLLLRGGALRRLRPVARWALDAAALAAVAGLVLMVHGLGEYDLRLYQGGFLVAALLAAVVVAAATQPTSLVARTLSASPLTGLGRISYGGYLFHWPLFIWLNESRTGLHGFPLLSLRVLATVALATVSYVLLESPVRKLHRDYLLAALTGWASATVGLVAAIVVASAAVPVSFGWNSQVQAAPPPVPHIAARVPSVHAKPAVHTPTHAPHPRGTASAHPTPSSSPTTDNLGFTTTPQKPKPPPSSAPAPGVDPLRVVIVGDSLASDLGAGMVSWADKRKDVVVYNLAIPGCPIAPGGSRRFPDGYTHDVAAECGWWTDPSDQRSINLAQFKPDVIVMQDSLNEMVDRKLNSWPAYTGPGDPLYDNWLLQEYQSAFSAMNPNGHATIVVLNAVCGDWEKLAHFQGSTAQMDQRVQQMNSDYNSLAQSTAMSLQDLDSNLCPGGQYTTTVDGVQDARPDGYHPSDAASLAVASTWLGPITLQADPRSVKGPSGPNPSVTPTPTSSPTALRRRNDG